MTADCPKCGGDLLREQCERMDCPQIEHMRLPRHPCAGRPEFEIDAFDALATGHEPGPDPDPEHRAALDRLVAAGLLAAFEIPGEAPVYAIPTPIHEQWCEAMGVAPPDNCSQGEQHE